MEQLSIFDFYKIDMFIDKPIRLIEGFAGYGSQAMALRELGANFEHYKISEWCIPSVNMYHAVHCADKYEPCNYSKEEAIQILLEYGVSMNGKEPLTEDSLKRKPVDWLNDVIAKFRATNNLGSITNIEGKDLEIVDTDKYEYMLTYSFPCVTEDSLILTKRGYIPIAEIEVGEEVLTKSNTWHKVAKKFDNGVHKTCFINAMGVENIHCTLNHKFYTRTQVKKYPTLPNGKRYRLRTFTEPEFKEAKDITTKDYLGIPVIRDEIPFYRDDEEFWYLIGMYLGDGWLSSTGNDIIIACNDAKLEKLQSRLSKEEWRYTVNNSPTCYRFRFSNKEIRRFIEENIGTGCESKFISADILKLPKKQLMALYEGYLDSDGCRINENVRQFSSVNRGLIYGMSAIINKLFQRPTAIYKVKTKPKTVIEGREVNQKDWYQLRFRMNKSKQDKAFYEDGYIWFPFKSLEMAEDEHVYNMEIEEDHSYILQGCISKNCQDLSVAGKQKGMSKGSGTRSGLLWEVERLLKECYEKDGKSGLPQILLMENVPQVHSSANMEDFQKWLQFLESIGYSNYYRDLNARDYGIAQNRERCFCISVLGDYKFTFPEPIPLTKKMKDYLEDEVDRKYYITSDKARELIDKLILSGQIPKIGGGYSTNRECVDLTVNEPGIIEHANCIKARYDAGIGNFRQDGSGVCECTRLH